MPLLRASGTIHGVALRDVAIVFVVALLAAWLARPRRDPLDEFDAWVKRRLREGRQKARNNAKG